LLSGHVHLWAQAPRFAWFHASLVTFVSNVSLRLTGNVVRLRGHGHLVPTFKSPASGSFTTAGQASLGWLSATPHAASQHRGRLILDFTVNNSAVRR
jgi:hypothetical protein